MGMVNKMRVIKNRRNELDIISLSLNHFKQMGARFPSPPTHLLLANRPQIEKRFITQQSESRDQFEYKLVLLIYFTLERYMCG